MLKLILLCKTILCKTNYVDGNFDSRTKNLWFHERKFQVIRKFQILKIDIQSSCQFYMTYYYLYRDVF